MLNEINRGEVRTPPAPLDLFDLGKRERQARIGYLKSTIMTCELAGFGGVAEVDRNLVEWNYGDYEGLRTVEIHARHGDWQLFRDGCPGGESPGQVGARADEVVRRLRGINGDVPSFSSGYFLQVLAARWLGIEPVAWKIPCTHRQSERARLRKQPVPAGDPILERHASFGRKSKLKSKYESDPTFTQSWPEPLARQHHS